MYKQELIDKLLLISPMANLYLFENSGISDFTNLQEGNLDVVYEYCAEICVNDLRSMGLTLDYDQVSWLSKSNMDTILTMRSFFDINNLARLRLHPKFDETVEGVIHNLLEESNLYMNLIEELSKLYPLSTPLHILNATMDRVTYDQAFAKHILAVLGMELPYSEQQEELVIKLTGRVSKHVKDLHRAYRFYTTDGSLDFVPADDYDVDLIHINPLSFGLVLFTEDSYILPEDCSDSEKLLKHITTNKHHIEYWTHSEEQPTKEDVVILALEYFQYPNKVRSVLATLADMGTELATLFEEITTDIKGYFN